MQVKEAKVEAIYPLNFLQQALLFHSLQQNVDQGFLRVKCVLKGPVNIEAFQNAWQQNIQRHEVLRTSIHWEKLEKPVQVVHKEASLPFSFHDWSQSSEAEQEDKLKQLLDEDDAQPFHLTKAPVLRIFLIKLSADKHLLLWDCHHMLTDGWSASIILQDLMALYEANCSGENVAALPAIPTHKSYLNWVKKQDESKTKTFWTEALKDFESPTLVGQKTPTQNGAAHGFKSTVLKLSEEESRLLRSIAQKNQVTLNTLIQGIWAILLSASTNHEDVTFGTIVSGRSIDLPNAERMAGMYMNILPLRIRLDGHEKLWDWLKSLQLQQSKIKAFEYINLDHILHVAGSANGNVRFDSVVVFENMPLENLRGGGVSIESFESGLTSNYAITLAISPLREIKALIKYDSALVSEQQVNWFLQNLSNLFSNIIGHQSDSLKEIRSKITPAATNKAGEELVTDGNTSGRAYHAPTNEAELMLVGMWEHLLNIQPIGINEDFFDLGGTSITAIRLFTEIEKRFQKKLQPISLLQHRTVAALATFIAEDDGATKFSSLVPLRASGSKPPVFCLHAGGGHVFFYKDLAKRLGADQPVYALQRLGVDELKQAAQDIESTAAHYLQEIRKVQPTGPFVLLAYCFSISICWEIIRQLKDAGHTIPLMVVVDSSPPFQKKKVQKKTTAQRIGGAMKKTMLLDFSFIKPIWNRKVRRPVKVKWITMAGSNKAKEQLRYEQKMQALNAIYDAYVWQPLPVKLILIRSAEYASNDRKNERVKRWNSLALNGVDTYVVEGHHEEIFNEPEVQQLADQMKQCLDKAWT